MRGLAKTPLILGIAAVLAGRTATGEGARTGEQPVSSVPPSSTVSSGPAAPTESELRAMLKAALIAPTGLVAVGGPATVNPDDDEDEHPTSEYCDRQYLEPSRNVHVSILRSWEAGGIHVSQVVHGYTSTGVDVLAFVRDTVRSCQVPYTTSSGSQRSIVSAVDLGVVPGTEASVGVCERIQIGSGQPFIFCQAHLARGHIVANIGVRVRGKPLSDNEAMLKRLVPVAAAALAHVG